MESKMIQKEETPQNPNEILILELIVNRNLLLKTWYNTETKTERHEVVALQTEKGKSPNLNT